MASQRQIDANKSNAQRSTGPRSPDGRRTASQNSRRHGLCAKIASLPEPDQAEFRMLAEGVEHDLAPSGRFEELIVDEIATGFWRIRRALQVEAEAFAYLSGDVRVRRLRSEYGRAWQASLDGSRVSVDSAKLQQLRQATNEAEQERDALAPLALAFLHGDHIFERVLRYRTTAERSLHRAIDQLRRLRESSSTMGIPPGLTAAADDVAAMMAACTPGHSSLTDVSTTGDDAETSDNGEAATGLDEELVPSIEPD